MAALLVAAARFPAGTAPVAGRACRRAHTDHSGGPRRIVEVEDTGPYEYPPDAGTRRLSDVQLDEILPHEHGCSHEIKMINGLITVVCADLTATWIPAH